MAAGIVNIPVGMLMNTVLVVISIEQTEEEVTPASMIKTGNSTLITTGDVIVTWAVNNTSLKMGFREMTEEAEITTDRADSKLSACI